MSVDKNKQNRFYFSVRYTDNTGKVIQKKVENSAWKNKKEALQAEREFLLSLVQPNIKDITYSDLYDYYLIDKKDRVKLRTLQTYKDAHEHHILPEFGNNLVSKISKNQIRSWQRQLLNKGYANAYLKTIQASFKRVLLWGERNDFIEKNPYTIENIRATTVKHTMQYFTPEEYSKFESVITDKTDHLIFDILYWCGLRKGEMQALTFNDINLVTGTLTVSKNYDYRNHKVTTPKTFKSNRDVMLTDKLVADLSEYKAACSKLAGFSDKLFLFGLDKPIAASTLERKKNQYCDLAKVKQIRIHDFRHSHVSLLINNNVSDYDISQRLGHSRDMVNNIYGHWFKDSQMKLVLKLNELDKDVRQTTGLKS